jgi:hypothetical protein
VPGAATGGGHQGGSGAEKTLPVPGTDKLSMACQMLHNVVAAVYRGQRSDGATRPAPGAHPRLDGWEWALVFFYL